MKTTVTLLLLTVFALSGCASTLPCCSGCSEEVSSISPKNLDGLLNGKGMGLAKAAELNHYPGPKHVLDLAEDLALSHEQLVETIVIFTRMNDDATRLGGDLICAEKKLDLYFRREMITAKKLKMQLSKIERIRRELREVHLKAHLDQRQVLAVHQIERYDTLRGYRQSQHIYEHSHSLQSIPVVDQSASL